MNRYLVAKVRISEQNTKEKSIFLLFSSESWLYLEKTQLIFGFLLDLH